MFDEIIIEKFPVNFTNYSTYANNLNDNTLYSVIFGQIYNGWGNKSADEIKYMDNVFANVNFKIATEELNKSQNHNAKNFIFHVKLIEPAEPEPTEPAEPTEPFGVDKHIKLIESIESIELAKSAKLNKSRIIFSEFENFIEKSKNHDFIQNSENKIKMFNTSIKREIQENTAEPDQFDKFDRFNPNTYYNKNNQKPSDENDTKDTKDTKDTNIGTKSEDVKADTKTEAKVENVDKKINQKKNKKNKHDKDKFYQMDHYGSNIYENHYGLNMYQNHWTMNNGYQKIQKKEIPVVVTEEINEKYKSIDTLYLRENDYKKLVNVLSRFKNCGHLYEKYGLPNKLGILLHGHPGTGKSTTIQVIGSYLQKNVYCVDLSSVESNEELQMIFDEINNALGGGIIVFEDIDAMTSIVHNRKNNNVSEGAKLTLDYFLNLLQGSLTRDGTIFIATTNHIEKLDPAFYRIGRFDVNIEMKRCDSYQIATIFEKFVGRHIDKEVINKIESEKFTPAEIIFHLVNFIDSDEPDDEIMKNFYNKNNLISI